ncbi:cation:proton antiporter [Variovorax sp. PCZ-1]|uniref:cation:proton antiporter domain-containing protein n=1 Tax=Variovorax sp. PCZ-1 TaxID=2835533 RepID=UPI001BCE9829|nr:cation:proton antiporter [Variovorax sp. PCZ-1]MBS7808495.1 cation:proton antiporter [Variovorax sp. PCZ-1]
MAVIILTIGAVIFLSHFLSLLFKKTNIPDVLLLMGLGLLLGPVLGWVDGSDFGKIGPIIATIALVVILFEGGTSLQLSTMRSAIATTGAFALACFLVTALIVIACGMYFLQLALLPAAMLGIILAGTSSAVVIPMVSSLRMGEKAGTVMVLESALTDVLCIVGVVALLHIHAEGNVEAGKLMGNVLSSLIFAAVIGILGGLGWLLILGKVRDFPNTLSSTIAYAFIVYGLTEFLGFSGAIAAMTLGITLTNFGEMGLKRFKPFSQNVEALTEFDRAFYREAVFLLKTYFFVYLGVSMQFHGWTPVYVALGMMGLTFASRIFLTRTMLSGDDFSGRDKALASMLAPKGLAAAVLAAVPLQYGVPGAAVIRDTTYMVVLVSICICAALVMAYSLKPVRAMYSAMLGK